MPLSALLLLACVHSDGGVTRTPAPSSAEPMGPRTAPPAAAPTLSRGGPGAPTSIEGLPAVTTPTGLTYWVLREGTGPTPTPGQTVHVHYTGWLSNGTKFDSSYDRGRPLDFQVGAGRVIKGWDEGVATMKVGEMRQLLIPPALGYGPSGAGGVIPPNATLVFDVELLDVGP
jgi:peptidylprolyl isomerase